MSWSDKLKRSKSEEPKRKTLHVDMQDSQELSLWIDKQARVFGVKKSQIVKAILQDAMEVDCKYALPKVGK